jgi:hypothetical protein
LNEVNGAEHGHHCDARRTRRPEIPFADPVGHDLHQQPGAVTAALALSR